MISTNDKFKLFDYISEPNNLIDFNKFISTAGWLPKSCESKLDDHIKNAVKLLPKVKDFREIFLLNQIFNQYWHLNQDYSLYLIAKIEKPTLNSTEELLLGYYYELIPENEIIKFLDREFETASQETNNNFIVDIFDSLNISNNQTHPKTLIKEYFGTSHPLDLYLNYFQAKRFYNQLIRIVDGNDEMIIKACEYLALMHREPCYIVPIIFVGFDSELDDIKLLGEYKDTIIQEAQPYLSFLEDLFKESMTE